MESLALTSNVPIMAIGEIGTDLETASTIGISHGDKSDRRIFEYIGTVPFHLLRVWLRGLTESKTASGILRHRVTARVSRNSRYRLGLECFLK